MQRKQGLTVKLSIRAKQLTNKEADRQTNIIKSDQNISTHKDGRQTKKDKVCNIGNQRFYISNFKKEDVLLGKKLWP